MLEQMSTRFAHWFVIKGAEQKLEEVYAYAFECLLSSLIANGLLLIIGLLIGRLFEIAVWIAFWLPLRVHLGGAHASTHFACLLFTTILGVASVLIAASIQLSLLHYLTAVLICFIATKKIAPVTHENHPVSKDRREKANRQACAIVLIECSLIIIAYILSYTRIASAAFSGIASAVILGALGTIKNKIPAK